MEEIQISTLPLPPHYIAALRQTQQNPRYHAEGNVLVHTEMVLSAYQQYSSEFELSESDHEVLYWAAVLHDIGKPSVTEWKEYRWSAHGHERAGVPIARDILLQKPEISVSQRQRILDLVKYHAIPLQWGIRKKPVEAYKRLATRTDLRLLGIFAYFDIRGRLCERKEEILALLKHFNETVVPKIQYEMGTYEQMQETYDRVGLNQKNALWNSLKMADIRLVEKLLQVRRPQASMPKFTAVIPLGALSSTQRDTLSNYYPGFRAYDAGELELDFSDPHGREGQLRQLKHFISVYGRAGKNLLIEGFSSDQETRRYLTEHLRKEGAWVEYIFSERSLNNLLGEAETDADQLRLTHVHETLDFPHPWEAHRIRRM